MLASECVIPDPVNPANLKAYNGYLVLTAANGDTVNATYDGTFVRSANAQVFTTSGLMFNIVGGTGLYAKATGHGNLHGTQSVSTGLGTLTATGVITY